MANSKEAKARIKINKLLEQAGWRFFDLPAEAPACAVGTADRSAQAGNEKGQVNRVCFIQRRMVKLK